MTMSQTAATASSSRFGLFHGMSRYGSNSQLSEAAQAQPSTSSHQPNGVSRHPFSGYSGPSQKDTPEWSASPNSYYGQHVNYANTSTRGYAYGPSVRETDSPQRRDTGKGKARDGANAANGPGHGDGVGSLMSGSWDSLMDEETMNDPFGAGTLTSQGSVYMSNHAYGTGGVGGGGSLQGHGRGGHGAGGSTSGHGHSDSYSSHPYASALSSIAAELDEENSSNRGRPRSPQRHEQYRQEQRHPFASSSSAAPVNDTTMSPTSTRGRGATYSGAMRSPSKQQQQQHQLPPHHSFVNPDLNAVGIGESPVPAQRSSMKEGAQGHGLWHRSGHQHARSQDSVVGGNGNNDHLGFGIFTHHNNPSSQSQHQQPPHSITPLLQGDKPQEKALPARPSPRGSFSSFWTFGQGSSHRKEPPSLAPNAASSSIAGTSGRPSGESGSASHQSSSRLGTSAAAVGSHYALPSSSTMAIPYQHPTHLNANSTSRPRANTALEMLPAHASSELLSPVSHTQALSMRKSEVGAGLSSEPYYIHAPGPSGHARNAALNVAMNDSNGSYEEQEHDNREDQSSRSSSSPYPSHPYATAQPNKGHREFSALLPRERTKSKERRVPLLNFALPSKQSLNNLRAAASRTSRSFLKASASTPNLRAAASSSLAGPSTSRSRFLGLGAVNPDDHRRGSSPNTPGSAGFGAPMTKWLSAETWCDALIFPRPRFRMRGGNGWGGREGKGAAHVISPPGSPELVTRERDWEKERMFDAPPHSAPAPLTTMTRSYDLAGEGGTEDMNMLSWNGIGVERRLGEGLLVPPSSAPPLFISDSTNTGVGGGFKPHEVEQQRQQDVSRIIDKGKKPVRPPRPKSFALDDLALPSPEPSLKRVLREGDEFNKERDEWKQQASNSFANKRTRSLSKSRAKAMQDGRMRKTSADHAELKASFTRLAASALLGHQIVKPTVSEPSTSGSGSKATNSTGMNTISTVASHTNTHSRKSSGMSNGMGNGGHKGHGRKESWGKTALKTANVATGGLCAFGIDVSPIDEKVSPMEGPDEQGKYVRMNSGDKSATAGMIEKPGAPGLLIIPAAHPKPPPEYAPQNRSYKLPSPSPVPSQESAESSSNHGVGIALSTPTALTGRTQGGETFQFPTRHPFAAALHSAGNDGIPHSSEYAGPHPSSAKARVEFDEEDAMMRDINYRHRKQPSAGTVGSYHPYSAAANHQYVTAAEKREKESRPKPTLKMPTGGGGLAVPPTSSMFALGPTGSVREILPEEIQYSPYSQVPSGQVSSRNSDALGVAEALNAAFSRGREGSGDSGNDDEVSEDDTNPEDNENYTGVSVAAAQIVTAMPAVRSPAELRSMVMPMVNKTSSRPSSDRSGPSDDDLGNRSVVSSLRRSPTAPSTFLRKKESSPGLSLDSSPMASPRQFSSTEEEDYRDLFYRPGTQSAGNSIRRSPSSEFVRSLSIGSRDPSGSEHPRVFSRPALARSASGSALANLSRQLNEEYSAQLDVERHTFGILAEDSPRSARHFGDLIEADESERVDDTGDEDGRRESYDEDGIDTSVPLNVASMRPSSLDPSVIIPEDVESDRTSSIVVDDEAEEGADVFYRLGEVPSLATPDPTATEANRFSTAVSYIDHGDDAQVEETHRPQVSPYGSQMRHMRPGRGTAHSSLVPPMSATTDMTRSSYVTSTSSASRMSQLSDFPAPPTFPQDVISPGAIINSYFNPTPDVQKANPLEREEDERESPPTSDKENDTTVTIRPMRSRRTTFGGEEVPNLDL